MQEKGDVWRKEKHNQQRPHKRRYRSQKIVAEIKKIISN